MDSNEFATPVALVSDQQEAGQKPFRVPEAARLLGVCNETLRTHLESGRVKGTKLGQWLIPAEEISRLAGGARK